MCVRLDIKYINNIPNNPIKDKFKYLLLLKILFVKNIPL